MFSLRQTVASTILNEIVTSADAGADNARIVVYDGNIPSSADGGLLNNFVLAEIECAKPCATISGRNLTFNTTTPDNSINRSGTATFFRLMDSDANVIAQGVVSSNNGTGSFRLESTSLVEGGTLSIVNASITLN